MPSGRRYLLIALYRLQNAYFLKIKLVQPRKACFSSRKASWVATTKLFQEEQARNLGKRRLSSGSLRSRTGRNYLTRVSRRRRVFDDSDKDRAILNHLNFCFPPLFLFVTPTTVVSPVLSIALETHRPHPLHRSKQDLARTYTMSAQPGFQQIKVVTNSFPIKQLPTRNYHQYDGAYVPPI